MRILSLLWGFSLGGIGKCAIAYHRLEEISNITFKTVCIYGVEWDCDLSPLKKIDADFIPIRSRTDFSWIGKCLKFYEKFSPDIVFVHGFNGPIVAWILQSFNKGKFPFICSYHGFYHPPSLSRIPFGPIFNKTVEYVYRNHATAIVAVAKYCKDQLVFRGVPEDKIAVVHNGIGEFNRTDKLLTRAKLGLRNSDFVIGVASRLDPIKGIKYLVNAMPSVIETFPESKLVIFGEGNIRKYLEKQCKIRDISKAICFVGYKANIPKWLNALDLFALPSLEESNSIGLLEAMRAGLPIVATNVGGNPESIIDGVSGLLVPPKDSNSLATAIIKCIQDKDLRESLGKEARKRFLSEFTLEKHLHKTADWLLSCAK